MADFPAMPLWTDAYLADTRHLSQAEHGAYLLLLMTAWRSKDCGLPDDDKILARYAGCDLRTWMRQKETILGFFAKGEDGLFRQKRQVKERNYVEHKSNKNADAARARWLKSKKTGNANAYANAMPRARDLPTPTPILTEPSPTSESIKQTQSLSPALVLPVEEPAQKTADEFPILAKLKREGHGRRYAYPRPFGDFWEAYSERRKADSKPDAYKAWRKAVVIDKLDPEMLAACAANYAHYCQQGHEPPLVATWFNKQRWNSQASQGATEPTRNNGHGKIKSNEQLAREMADELERESRWADGAAQGPDGNGSGCKPSRQGGPRDGSQGDGQGNREVPAWFDSPGYRGFEDGS